MKRIPHTLSRLLGIAALFVGVLAWTGCDSDSDDGFSEDDLVGTYDVDEIVFETNGTLVPDADVTARLVGGNTSLRFLANGTFQMNYQFQGEPELSLFGTYDVSGSRVQLDTDSAVEDERKTLLLPDRFSLDILEDGARLEAAIGREDVDLSDFDPEFGDIQSDGTLNLRFSRR